MEEQLIRGSQVIGMTADARDDRSFEQNSMSFFAGWKSDDVGKCSARRLLFAVRQRSEQTGDITTFSLSLSRGLQNLTKVLFSSPITLSRMSIRWLT